MHALAPQASTRLRGTDAAHTRSDLRSAPGSPRTHTLRASSVLWLSTGGRSRLPRKGGGGVERAGGPAGRVSEAVTGAGAARADNSSGAIARGSVRAGGYPGSKFPRPPSPSFGARAPSTRARRERAPRISPRSSASAAWRRERWPRSVLAADARPFLLTRCSATRRRRASKTWLQWR